MGSTRSTVLQLVQCALSRLGVSTALLLGSRSRHFLVTIAWLVASCGPPPRGTPLYDASQGVLPIEQVARLSGQIIAIDGSPVTQSTQRFELLPDCYRLRMAGTVGYSDATQAGGVQIHMGEQEFAVHLEAGHQYYVELQTGSLTMSSPTGRVEVRWVVRDFNEAGKEEPPLPLFDACR